jgi:SpoVK/Ycf46/Vps4 family AAA+-type ATPase
MARSDLLRRLFAAWSSNDQGAFLHTATQIIDDERRKNHALLAKDLEKALRDPRRPSSTPALSLKPLPRGKDDRVLLRISKPARTLDDLVFEDDSRSALADLIRENHSRGALLSMGLRPRQRLLVVGPPGTGKSMSAHALASELSFPVATASLASLTSSLLGETARNIEAVTQFIEHTPCVLVLDEFDALAAERATGGDHGELKRVVATVLQSLEEVRGESIIVATSNHPDLLDDAVWRRFDEVISLGHLSVPNVRHLIRAKLSILSGSVDVPAWAERLSNLSPADIERWCLDVVREGVLRGDAQVIEADADRAWLRQLHRQRVSDDMARTGRVR